MESFLKCPHCVYETNARRNMNRHVLGHHRLEYLGPGVPCRSFPPAMLEAKLDSLRQSQRNGRQKRNYNKYLRGSRCGGEAETGASSQKMDTSCLGPTSEVGGTAEGGACVFAAGLCPGAYGRGRGLSRRFTPFEGPTPSTSVGGGVPSAERPLSPSGTTVSPSCVDLSEGQSDSDFDDALSQILIDLEEEEALPLLSNSSVQDVFGDILLRLPPPLVPTVPEPPRPVNLCTIVGLYQAQGGAIEDSEEEVEVIEEATLEPLVTSYAKDLPMGLGTEELGQLVVANPTKSIGDLMELIITSAPRRPHREERERLRQALEYAVGADRARVKSIGSIVAAVLGNTTATLQDVCREVADTLDMVIRRPRDGSPRGRFN
jgi:hypothetical protein